MRTDNVFPERKTKKINIRDVAREAGVSAATVSRVLSRRRAVRRDLTERVIEASRALGYTPSVVARNLREGRSHTVGLILSDVSNPFFGKIVRATEDDLHAAGYGVVIFNTDNTVQKEALAVQRAIEMRLDGLVVSSTSRQGEHFERVRREGVPLVFVNREPDNVSDDSVMSDSVGGAERGVAHLIAQGHERIGMVVGPQRYSSARRRQMGYHKALVEAGLPLRKELMVEARETTFECGIEAVNQLLALAPRPTAIFVTNNGLTLGVVTGLCRAGVAVPRQMSVLGFDNPPWASLFGLHGIMQATQELGRKAAFLLRQRMEGFAGPPQRIVLETELVRGEELGS